MSNPDTPITGTDSLDEFAPRSGSSQASTPMTDEPGQDQKTAPQDKMDISEDIEGMDVKAKALMHLLNTSEVRLFDLGPGENLGGAELLLMCLLSPDRSSLRSWRTK